MIALAVDWVVALMASLAIAIIAAPSGLLLASADRALRGARARSRFGRAMVGSAGVAFVFAFPLLLGSGHRGHSVFVVVCVGWAAANAVLVAALVVGSVPRVVRRLRAHWRSAAALGLALLPFGAFAEQGWRFRVERHALRRAIDAGRAEAAALSDVAGRLEDFRRKDVDLQQRSAYLQQILPREPDATTFMADYAALVRECGVAINHWHWVERQRGPIAAAEIVLELTGPAEAIRRLRSRTSRQIRLVHWRSQSAGDEGATVTLLLYAYAHAASRPTSLPEKRAAPASGLWWPAWRRQVEELNRQLGAARQARARYDAVRTQVERFAGQERAYKAQVDLIACLRSGRPCWSRASESP